MVVCYEINFGEAAERQMSKYIYFVNQAQERDYIQSNSDPSSSIGSRVGLDEIGFFLCLFCFSFLLNIFTYIAF